MVRKNFRELADFGPLRMRLQRFGNANCSFYKVVVAQARFRRNGRYHDILGTYYPHPSTHFGAPNLTGGEDSMSATDASKTALNDSIHSTAYKHICLDFEKAKYWIAAGAEATPMVAKLLSKVRNSF
jgi:ribosomal protein S16